MAIAPRVEDGIRLGHTALLVRERQTMVSGLQIDGDELRGVIPSGGEIIVRDGFGRSATGRATR